MRRPDGPARRVTAARERRLPRDTTRPRRPRATRACCRPGHDGSGRVCVWCCGPIPARARRDAVCCSVRCRQARHRFLRTIGRARSRRAGPAAPPGLRRPALPGPGWLYRDHPDYAGEVDHAALIAPAGRLRRVGAVHLGRGAARRAGAVPARGAGRGLAPRRPAHPGPLAAARLGTGPVLRWPPGQPSPGRDTTR